MEDILYYTKTSISKFSEKYVKMAKECPEIQAFCPPGLEYWIPSQEDLQYLLKRANLPKYVNCIGNDMKMDTFLRTTLSKFICCGGFNRISFNEAWIQFYMIEVHGKRWMSSPEKWCMVEK
jgi:hypothetical protein